MDQQEQKHKRRVRYKGTHPKNYKEKYKELAPDKYTEDVEKIIQKGNTPAGMHRSICVKEIMTILAIKPGEKGFDATLGYGGHTLEMLKALDHTGHVYATDVDPIELPKTTERLRSHGFDEKYFTPVPSNFCKIDEIYKTSGPFDFILADLGVSSMQIDNPDRGFSFKTEGPLDLRLNPNVGISAAERLLDITKDELAGMLMENADEPHAEIIARAIIAEIKRGRKIQTTTHLKQVISDALQFLPEKTRKEDIKKTCQRSFQALRIDVNNEYEVLYEFLEKIPHVLAPNGRVAILTFHSGEDRLVKKSFKAFYKEGLYKVIADEPIKPTMEECNTNSRARSAKLRWAIKAD